MIKPANARIELPRKFGDFDFHIQFGGDDREPEPIPTAEPHSPIQNALNEVHNLLLRAKRRPPLYLSKLRNIAVKYIPDVKCLWPKIEDDTELITGEKRQEPFFPPVMEIKFISQQGGFIVLIHHRGVLI